MTTKILALTDALGNLVRFVLLPGQRYDTIGVAPLIEGVAFGADLLVTDQRCRKAWSVQVKTNRRAASFWLVNAHTGDSYSESHVYVFVNLKGESRPDYFVVPSTVVARIHRVDPAKTGSVWYSVHHRDMPDYAEAWVKVFGDASADEPVA